jgi:hypothetical protein
VNEQTHYEGPFGTVTTFVTDDVCAYLSEKMPSFPRGGRLFHEGREVTPRTEAEVAALQGLSGEFRLEVVPGEAVTVALVASTLLSVGVGLLLRPSLPDFSQELDDNWDPGSPTNAPGKVSNRERLGKRVPDIYGHVKHTPDKIAPTLIRYEQGRRVEYNYYCIGRGEFSDSTCSLTDGDVPVQDVDGYSAKIFGPGGDIGDTPQVLFGDDFDVFSMYHKQVENAKYEALPPNPTTNGMGRYIDYETGTPRAGIYVAPLYLVSDTIGHVRNREGDYASANYDAAEDFEKNFVVGSVVEVNNVAELDTAGAGSWDSSTPHDAIEGQYVVTKVTSDWLWLDIPDDKKAAWNALPQSALIGCGLSGKLREHTYTAYARGRVEVTFEAPGGLYTTEAQHEVTALLTVSATWQRADGGGPSLFNGGLGQISAASRNRTGVTVVIENPHSDKRPVFKVDLVIRRSDNFSRLTPGWSSSSQGRVDLIGITGIMDTAQDSYTVNDEVSTILTRVVDTSESRALRNRVLEIETIRRLPVYGTGQMVDAILMDQILYGMLIDERIGKLPASAAAYSQWGETIVALASHFAGGTEAVEFSYVFDDANTTFEEMVAVLAQRCFCTAYRYGAKIYLKPDLPENTPVLIFNVRNKIPGTEVRTVRFGTENDYDGVVQRYVDSDDRWLVKEFTVPEDTMPTTPQVSEIVGLTHERQAHIHAYRLYARQRYQHTQVQFEATSEAAILLPGDLIVVSDGTRLGVYEGDLVDVSGTSVTLNYSITLPAGSSYIAFFQMPDGTVLARNVVGPIGGTSSREFTISAPLPDSSTNPDFYARTTFLIIEDPGDGTAGDSERFVVQSIEPANPGTFVVTARNYAEEVYDEDSTWVS